MPDSLPVAGVDTDWREFRARLVAGSQKKATPPADSTDEAGPSGQAETSHWAHTIPRPEQGCLLIAHPLMFVQQQTYFNQVRVQCDQHLCPIIKLKAVCFSTGLLYLAICTFSHCNTTSRASTWIDERLYDGTGCHLHI